MTVVLFPRREEEKVTGNFSADNVFSAFSSDLNIVWFPIGQLYSCRFMKGYASHYYDAYKQSFTPEKVTAQSFIRPHKDHRRTLKHNNVEQVAS